MEANRARHSIIITLVAMILVGFGNVVYTRHVQSETQHKFCGVVRAYDTQGTPASTPRGVELQNRFHELRVNLGC